jgi:hypothetical protein
MQERKLLCYAKGKMANENVSGKKSKEIFDLRAKGVEKNIIKTF